jgi:hypothetical protein
MSAACMSIVGALAMEEAQCSSYPVAANNRNGVQMFFQLTQQTPPFYETQGYITVKLAVF